MASMGWRIVLTILCSWLTSAAWAQSEFDQGIDVQGALAGLGSGAPAPPSVGGGGIIRDLTELGAEIDPTSMPYPHGADERRAEEQRVAQWLAPRVKGLAPAAASVLADARATGVSDVDLFHGSHVVVKDGGWLYARWTQEGAAPRISSHYQGLDVQQYEVRLHGIGVLLFGKDWDGDTWFQLEPFGASAADALQHVGEYIRHELTGGMNVGPLGLSPYTDARKDPIVVAMRG